MITIAAAAALALTAQSSVERPVGDPATPIEVVQLAQFEKVARDWLALVDAGDWEASFAEAGRPFRDPNTPTTWRDAYLQVRAPMGTMIERTALTVDFVQSGPSETEANPSVVLRFSTRFEDRPHVIETVRLEQEQGVWKVMAYVFE